MSKELENLKEIRALLEQGISLSFIESHVVVNDVPYLDDKGELKWAKLAAALHLPTPDSLGKPFNHQMYWSGSYPCFTDGANIPVNKIEANVELAGTQFKIHLSNKPMFGSDATDFDNYYDLIEHYVALISGPATEKFDVTPYTGAKYDVSEEESVFKIADTFSAKAEITDLNKLVSEDRIAIIGLGGTGSFILDFITKTPVHSIDAYDFDIFEVHNAFRSPGGFQGDEFGDLKTAIYHRKYDSLRHRFKTHKKKVGKGDEALFTETTFAFVCVDDGEARAEICDMLIALKIPFIDVGMGVEKEGGTLDGLLRTTIFNKNTAAQARQEIPTDKREGMGAYRTYVQISELNALNAAVAVICYKKFRKFYCDEEDYFQNYISIGTSNWIGGV